MKKISTILMLLSSLSLFAQNMGPEAVEIFQLMNNHDAKACIEKANASSLVNVKITKTVYRCPGCTNYTISGGIKSIDMIKGSVEVNLVGHLVPGAFGQRVQNYDCNIKKIK